MAANLPPHPRRAEAEAMLRAGKTPREVADATGASLSAVKKWRERLHLNLPPVSRPGRAAGAAAQGIRAEALRMLAEGKPVPEIAAALGVTQARVRQIRAELDRG